MAKRNRAERREAKARRRERKGELVLLDGGLDCPRGHGPMQRCAHGPEWKPRPSQPYYFQHWDRCLRCNHLQHYETAKVLRDVAELLADIELHGDAGHRG